MSELSPEFAQAWIDALSEMPDLRADQTANAGQYSYKWADLRQLLNLVRPILHRHKMGIHQEVRSTDLSPAVQTIVTYTTGEQMPVGDLVMPASGGAQQIGSAITYARRYSLTAALGLAVEDDDGKAASTPPSVGSDPDQFHPVKEEPAFDAKAWLDLTSKALVGWSDAERSAAGAVAVAVLKPGKPMTKLEAEKVYAHMSAAYFEQSDADGGADE